MIKNVKNKVKVKKQIESNKTKNGAKANNYIDASSNELKYFVHAKIPAMRKEQLISSKQYQSFK
jgi:hypothetical protein